MKKVKTKLIAMYLPQYHSIPENDAFWGKGFSDWVTVKKAKPIYNGHIQPKIPLNDNYYDLSLKDNVIWQADLASKYGISVFGVYHYWFNNEKNLLTKPAEIMRDSSNLKVKYFYVWDNASWKRSWSNVTGNDWAPIEDQGMVKQGEPPVLIPYILGEEPDWRNHYNYVLQHFKSNNYLLIDNKPVFSIIRNDEKILEMCEKWNEWAKEDGFDGVFFIFQNANSLLGNHYKYNYEPHSSSWNYNAPLLYRLKKLIFRMIRYHKRMFYDYDMTWRQIIKSAQNSADSKLFYGAFVTYDDSPRRGGEKGKILRGATPAKFKKYLKKLMEISASQNKEYIFLTAWNEWGEGAYLEPDVVNQFRYLEAIKSCVNELGYEL